jgi:Sulfotransferase family
MSTALVHIGVPKTGTTSFQQWIYRHRATLEETRSITLHDSIVPHVRKAQIHPELLLLSQRPERDCVAKLKIGNWATEDWQRAAKAQIAATVGSDAETVMFTHEGLFLLRNPDEVERLAELLAPRDLRVVVCLREPASFLRSYRSQMHKNDFRPSTDPDSSFYLEDDSWMVDWAEMLRVWRSVLGEANVVAIDYEQSMATHGSTTQPILEAFGIDTTGLPPMDSDHANRSRNPRVDLLTKRVIRRVRRLFL